MRALATTVVLLGLVLVPMAASAQSVPLIPGSVEIAMAGGASVPFGDFNTIANTGFGISGMATFYVMPALGVGAEASYNSYGTTVPDVDITVMEFSAFGKYSMMPGPVNPYIKAGVGVFSSKATGLDATNDMGINGGIGAQMRLPSNNIGFFAEGLAYSVFTEGSSTNYYTIRGGISYFLSPKN